MKFKTKSILNIVKRKKSDKRRQKLNFFYQNQYRKTKSELKSYFY